MQNLQKCKLLYKSLACRKRYSNANISIKHYIFKTHYCDDSTSNGRKSKENEANKDKKQDNVGEFNIFGEQCHWIRQLQPGESDPTHDGMYGNHMMYHKYTYFETYNHLQKFRNPQPNSNKKKNGSNPYSDPSKVPQPTRTFIKFIKKNPHLKSKSSRGSGGGILAAGRISPLNKASYKIKGSPIKNPPWYKHTAYQPLPKDDLNSQVNTKTKNLYIKTFLEKGAFSKPISSLDSFIETKLTNRLKPVKDQQIINEEKIKHLVAAKSKIADSITKPIFVFGKSSEDDRKPKLFYNTSKSDYEENTKVKETLTKNIPTVPDSSKNEQIANDIATANNKTSKLKADLDNETKSTSNINIITKSDNLYTTDTISNLGTKVKNKLIENKLPIQVSHKNINITSNQPNNDSESKFFSQIDEYKESILNSGEVKEKLIKDTGPLPVFSKDGVIETENQKGNTTADKITQSKHNTKSTSDINIHAESNVTKGTLLLNTDIMPNQSNNDSESTFLSQIDEYKESILNSGGVKEKLIKNTVPLPVDSKDVIETKNPKGNFITEITPNQSNNDIKSTFLSQNEVMKTENPKGNITAEIITQSKNKRESISNVNLHTKSSDSNKFLLPYIMSKQTSKSIPTFLSDIDKFTESVSNSSNLSHEPNLPNNTTGIYVSQAAFLSKIGESQKPKIVKDKTIKNKNDPFKLKSNALKMKKYALKMKSDEFKVKSNALKVKNEDLNNIVKSLLAPAKLKSTKAPEIKFNQIKLSHEKKEQSIINDIPPKSGISKSKTLNINDILPILGPKSIILSSSEGQKILNFDKMNMPAESNNLKISDSKTPLTKPVTKKLVLTYTVQDPKRRSKSTIIKAPISGSNSLKIEERKDPNEATKSFIPFTYNIFQNTNEKPEKLTKIEHIEDIFSGTTCKTENPDFTMTLKILNTEKDNNKFTKPVKSLKKYDGIRKQINKAINSKVSNSIDKEQLILKQKMKSTDLDILNESPNFTINSEAILEEGVCTQSSDSTSSLIYFGHEQIKSSIISKSLILSNLERRLRAVNENIHNVNKYFLPMFKNSEATQSAHKSKQTTIFTTKSQNYQKTRPLRRKIEPEIPAFSRLKVFPKLKESEIYEKNKKYEQLKSTKPENEKAISLPKFSTISEYVSLRENYEPKESKIMKSETITLNTNPISSIIITESDPIKQEKRKEKLTMKELVKPLYSSKSKALPDIEKNLKISRNKKLSSSPICRKSETPHSTIPSKHTNANELDIQKQLKSKEHVIPIKFSKLKKLVTEESKTTSVPQDSIQIITDKTKEEIKIGKSEKYIENKYFINENPIESTEQIKSTNNVIIKENEELTKKQSEPKTTPNILQDVDVLDSTDPIIILKKKIHIKSSKKKNLDELEITEPVIIVKKKKLLNEESVVTEHTNPIKKLKKESKIVINTEIDNLVGSSTDIINENASISITLDQKGLQKDKNYVKVSTCPQEFTNKLKVDRKKISYYSPSDLLLKSKQYYKPVLLIHEEHSTPKNSNPKSEKSEQPEFNEEFEQNKQIPQRKYESNSKYPETDPLKWKFNPPPKAPPIPELKILRKTYIPKESEIIDDHEIEPESEPTQQHDDNKTNIPRKLFKISRRVNEPALPFTYKPLNETLKRNSETQELEMEDDAPEIKNKELSNETITKYKNSEMQNLEMEEDAPKIEETKLNKIIGKYGNSEMQNLKMKDDVPKIEEMKCSNSEMQNLEMEDDRPKVEETKFNKIITKYGNSEMQTLKMKEYAPKITEEKLSNETIKYSNPEMKNFEREDDAPKIVIVKINKKTNRKSDMQKLEIEDYAPKINTKYRNYERQNFEVEDDAPKIEETKLNKRIAKYGNSETQNLKMKDDVPKIIEKKLSNETITKYNNAEMKNLEREDNEPKIEDSKLNKIIGKYDNSEMQNLEIKDDALKIKEKKLSNETITKDSNFEIQKFEIEDYAPKINTKYRNYKMQNFEVKDDAPKIEDTKLNKIIGKCDNSVMQNLEMKDDALKIKEKKLSNETITKYSNSEMQKFEIEDYAPKINTKYKNYEIQNLEMKNDALKIKEKKLSNETITKYNNSDMKNLEREDDKPKIVEVMVNKITIEKYSNPEMQNLKMKDDAPKIEETKLSNETITKFGKSEQINNKYNSTPLEYFLKKSKMLISVDKLNSAINKTQLKNEESMLEKVDQNKEEPYKQESITLKDTNLLEKNTTSNIISADKIKENSINGSMLEKKYTTSNIISQDKNNEKLTNINVLEKKNITSNISEDEDKKESNTLKNISLLEKNTTIISQDKVIPEKNTAERNTFYYQLPPPTSKSKNKFEFRTLDYSLSKNENDSKVEQVKLETQPEVIKESNESHLSKTSSYLEKEKVGFQRNTSYSEDKDEEPIKEVPVLENIETKPFILVPTENKNDVKFDLKKHNRDEHKSLLSKGNGILTHLEYTGI